MKKSEYFYGDYYSKEFMKEHAVVFMRQAIWAEMLAFELMMKPIATRDMRRVNDCLKAAKWNREKYNEIYNDPDAD
jgi:hypothetical protein